MNHTPLQYADSSAVITAFLRDQVELKTIDNQVEPSQHSAVTVRADTVYSKHAACCCHAQVNVKNLRGEARCGEVWCRQRG